MKLLFQAFLTRLAAVETGLADNDPDEGEWATPNRSGGESLILGGIDLTYAVVVTCKEGDEPDTRPVVDYTSYDGISGTTEKQPVCRHCLFEKKKTHHSPVFSSTIHRKDHHPGHQPLYPMACIQRYSARARRRGIRAVMAIQRKRPRDLILVARGSARNTACGKW